VIEQLLTQVLPRWEVETLQGRCFVVNGLGSFFSETPLPLPRSPPEASFIVCRDAELYCRRQRRLYGCPETGQGAKLAIHTKLLFRGFPVFLWLGGQSDIARTRDYRHALTLAGPVKML
jgi:hypothetical protein